MSQATRYARQQDYSDWQDANPGKPLPGVDIDADYDALKVTTDEIIDNQILLQRDDGRQRNQTIHPNSFTQDSLNLMGGSWIPRSFWVTGTDYVPSDVIEYQPTGNSYVCAIAHKAGVFDTDRDNGLWVLIATPPVLNFNISSPQDRDLLEFDFSAQQWINVRQLFGETPTYTPGTDYRVSESVLYNDAILVCTQDHTAAALPDKNSWIRVNANLSRPFTTDLILDAHVEYAVHVQTAQLDYTAVTDALHAGVVQLQRVQGDGSPVTWTADFEASAGQLPDSFTPGQIELIQFSYSIETGKVVVTFLSDLANIAVPREWTAQQNFDEATISHTAAADITIDCDDQQVVRIDLGADANFLAATNQKAGSFITLELTYSGGAPHVITWQGLGFRWPSGVVPALSNADGAIDILTFKSDGAVLQNTAQALNQS